MSAAPLRVLYVASECAPLVKTGGLGDVAGALPPALRCAGLDVRVLMPAYRQVTAGLAAAQPAGRIEAFAELPAALLRFDAVSSRAPVLALDCPALYDREGGPYQDAHARDWPDNALRFGLLGRAAAQVAIAGTTDGWRPDIVHLNDWQAGLAAAYLRHSARPRAPVLFTVHNLAFPGAFDAQWLARLGLPPACWSIDGVEYHGRLSFLKAGLFYADVVTTVSPNYAREIQTAPLGMGFEGLLAARRDVLAGIVNGIDTAIWDPSHDPLIAARYDADSLEAKRLNKRALQRRFALEEDERVPLLGVVSRLTEQKGIDLVADIAEELIGAPAQLVVVGSGEPALEARVRALAQRHAGRIGARIGFDETAAHEVEAGADIFLMPSRFEPCGLNQMYSQRYGTVPVASATGGLVDTIVDCTDATLADGSATGWLFAPVQAPALARAIERALALWRDPVRWRGLQRAGMARDFGWQRPAAEYARLYARLARAEAQAS